MEPAALDELTLKNVLIVDDHPLFCDALSMTLKSALPVQKINTTTTIGEAFERLENGLVPDMIFLDLNLPDAEGLDGLIRLKGIADHIPVIIVSSMAENRLIGLAIEAGASGFVPKHSQRDVFLEAISTVLRGESFVPDTYLAIGAKAEPNADGAETVRRLTSLTQQQSRILHYVCEGKLNKQIAYELSIAETTVKAHITAILRKLGVQNRTQAVLLARSTQFSNLLVKDPVQH